MSFFDTKSEFVPHFNKLENFFENLFKNIYAKSSEKHVISGADESNSIPKK